MIIQVVTIKNIENSLSQKTKSEKNISVNYIRK